MIEKSQRGGGYSGGTESYERRGGISSLSSFSSTASSSVLASSSSCCPPTPPPLASVLVTGRWLDGVSQVLNGSPLTLDDLAYLAHLFPQWLRMKWSCSQRTSLPYHPNGGITAGVYSTGLLPAPKDSLLSSFSGYNISSSRSTITTGEGEEGRRRPPPLQARVYLIGDHVISIEEAYMFLEQRMSCEAAAVVGGVVESPSSTSSSSSVPSSSIPSSAMNPLHGTPITAYQAFLSQQQQRQGILQDKQEESEKEQENKTVHSTQDTNAKEENKSLQSSSLSSSSPPEHSSEKEANRLLSTALSPELLQSLSKEKLAHVLQQVRKDLSGEEEKQYKDIGRRRVREDILRTYTRIRSVIRRRTIASLPFLSKRNSTSLFSSNEKKHISLSQLMIQLQADNDNGGRIAASAGGVGGGSNSHLSNSGTHSYTASGSGTASRWSAESEMKAENLHLLQVIEELIRIPSSGLQLQNVGDRQQEEEGRESKVVGGANPVPCTSSSSSLISLSTLPSEEWHRVILCFDQRLASAKDVAAAVEVV